MGMGWFRRQLRFWEMLPPQRARAWLIGLGAGALVCVLLAVSVVVWGVSGEMGLGVALAALAMAILLGVPLMAGILMRRWPLGAEGAEGVDGHDSHLLTEPSASDPLMTEAAWPVSATLFDLELDALDAAHEEGLASVATMVPPWMPVAEAVNTETLRQAAVRCARNSHALGIRISAQLASVVQARQRMAESLAVIDTIACETNALALQAAMDRGCGQGPSATAFNACTEVRALAQRAASAAREIHGVVSATEAKIDPAVRQVVASIHTDALVADAQTMLACLDELDKPLAPNMSSAMPYAAHHPVARMDSVIERQNSWAHHSASLADTLSAQADRLHKVAEAFRVLQQTQEAAWMAEQAIHLARDQARDRTREGRKA